MGKYHHNARFEDHVITNVCVVTSHHHHRLLPRNPPSCVLLILPVKDKDQSLYHVFESLDFSILDFSDNRNFVGLYLGLL